MPTVVDRNKRTRLVLINRRARTCYRNNVMSIIVVRAKGGANVSIMHSMQRCNINNSRACRAEHLFFTNPVEIFNGAGTYVIVHLVLGCTRAFSEIYRSDLIIILFLARLNAFASRREFQNMTRSIAYTPDTPTPRSNSRRPRKRNVRIVRSDVVIMSLPRGTPPR